MAEGKAIALTAAAFAAAMFMGQLDATVIHTALPTLAGDFGVAPVDMSIGITVYLLAHAAGLPASAWLADRFGAKRIFAVSVLGFTFASLLCGLTQSLEQFVAARIFQGACAALMMPVGSAVLIRSAGKKKLVQVMSLTASVVLIAPTFGPAIGGFCVTYLTWPWAFFINIPPGLLSVYLIIRYVPELDAQEPRPFDTRGFVLAALAMTGILLGLDRISSASSSLAFALACLAVGAAAGILLLFHLRGNPHPILSAEPLQSRIYRIAVLGGGASIRIALRALPFILPLMFQLTMGMSAFAAGMALIMLNGSDLVIKPFIRKILARFGYRSNVIATSIAAAIGTALCAAFTPETPVWVILASLALIGASRSILFTGVQTLLYTEIPEEQTIQATVLWNVFQQLTSAIAISLTAIMLNWLAAMHGRWGDAPNLADFRIALLVIASLLVLAVFSFRRLDHDAGAELSGHKRT